MATKNQATDNTTETTNEVETVADQYADYKFVEYVDTPYTTDIILGQGVYIQALGPYDTFEVRSQVPYTTEPAVALIDGGFVTTNTKYLKVTA